MIHQNGSKNKIGKSQLFQRTNKKYLLKEQSLMKNGVILWKNVGEKLGCEQDA